MHRKHFGAQRSRLSTDNSEFLLLIKPRSYPRRFYPGGKPTPKDHIAAYKTIFSMSRDQMRCNNPASSDPLGSYDCHLTTYKGSRYLDLQRVPNNPWCAEMDRRFFPLLPKCSIESAVTNQLMTMDEFRSTYWR